MPRLQWFPTTVDEDSDGLVAIGGRLDPKTVLRAYREGVFPWPVPGLPMLWFSPNERGVLEFDRLHIPRSLRQARRRCRLEFTIDRAFAAVIRACAETPRPQQVGTWITPEVIRTYVRLHEMGVAHSVEAWRDGVLVGGLYGVDVDGAFAGESMFYREPNASKLALLFLIDHLASRGLDWMDIQMITPHMARLGARAIPRAEFLAKLAATRQRGLRLFDPAP
ncbi:MAG: leucyl/phenylalanyl-tRNA--protein transferase [Candidatus Binatia bacterium]|nr:MAG: leucyl/phenylalanyl-tRNA--protein transferase [Candidatus Binatia bacterium]